MTENYVKLSLEVNVIEINRFFFCRRNVIIKIEVVIKLQKWAPMGSKERKFPTMFKYVSAPPPPNPSLNTPTDHD